MEELGLIVLVVLTIFFGVIGWGNLMAGTFAAYTPLFQGLSILSGALFLWVLFAGTGKRSTGEENRGEEPLQLPIPKEMPFGEQPVPEYERHIPVYVPRS